MPHLLISIFISLSIQIIIYSHNEPNLFVLFPAISLIFIIIDFSYLHLKYFIITQIIFVVNYLIIIPFPIKVICIHLSSIKDHYFYFIVFQHQSQKLFIFLKEPSDNLLQNVLDLIIDYILFQLIIIPVAFSHLIQQVVPFIKNSYLNLNVYLVNILEVLELPILMSLFILKLVHVSFYVLAQ